MQDGDKTRLFCISIWEILEVLSLHGEISRVELFCQLKDKGFFPAQETKSKSSNASVTMFVKAVLTAGKWFIFCAFIFVLHTCPSMSTFGNLVWISFDSKKVSRHWNQLCCCFGRDRANLLATKAGHTFQIIFETKSTFNYLSYIKTLTRADRRLKTVTRFPQVLCETLYPTCRWGTW